MSTLYKFLFALCIIIFVIFIVIFFSIFKTKPFHYLYWSIKDSISSYKNKNLEKEFNLYGLNLYCGLGGSGKTLAMVERIKTLKEEFPNLYVVTNFTTSLSDRKMNDWHDLIEIENPKGQQYGVLFAFDEMHLTLSSDRLKNNPDGLLEYISQQRKLKKLILGSTQVFTRTHKILREQSNLVIDCKMIGTRWSFQNAYKTEDYLLNGELRDSGHKKRDTVWKRNFIATDKLRNLYDTHEVMKPLLKKENNIKEIKAC